VRVEVDMFSGRPNPQWEATEDEAARITASFEVLSDAADEPAIHDRLGYRGFVITCADGQTVRVQGTAVVVGAEPASRHAKSDPDRVLERTLLDIAQQHLPPQLHEFLVEQTRTN
jgi:hypothetical protein